MRDGCGSGIGDQMGGGSEVLAGDFGEDACAGPDADAGHRGQDLVKRVGLHQGLDLGGDLVSLPAQRQELLGLSTARSRPRRCRQPPPFTGPGR